VTATVLFSCVAENRSDFAAMAHNLAISIRAFAGTLSEAPIVVNFVDAVEPEFAAPLAALDVEVRVVNRVAGVSPLANKLRMLELDREREFDVLLALDSDVVVVGDPAPWIEPTSIGVKPADFDRFTEAEWSALFRVTGVHPPDRVIKATATGQPMFPYFNSGVVFVPRAYCAPLREAWMQTYIQLSRTIEQQRDLVREQWQWLAEQASLALAILRQDLPWRALPAALNFPSHVKVVNGALEDAPVILHYHADRDTQGFLLRSASPAVDPFLDRFNHERARITQLAYVGIQRHPLRRRVRRAIAQRFWALLADQGWYRSEPIRRMRKGVKRLAARARAA
jgi:hypothetical protein